MNMSKKAENFEQQRIFPVYLSAAFQNLVPFK